MEGEGPNARKLYAGGATNGYALRVEGGEADQPLSIPCRLNTLKDASEGLTVHLAGPNALCSISCAHSVIHVDVTSSRGSATHRFAFSQEKLREIVKILADELR
jgi:hypothetical protein